MLSSPPGRREYLLDTPQAESHYIWGSISFMNLSRELSIIGIGLQSTALLYLAGIGIFLSKSQRGDRPRLRESHLGGKSFLDGQHQNTTSGMVPRIPLPKIQPEERKRFSAGFIFYLFAVWEAMSAFFFRHMRCRQKQWIQLFTSHREVVKN